MKNLSLEEFRLRNFLDRCREIIENKPENLKLIPRKKNMDSLYSMGLTPLDIEEIVCDLTPENYFRGPSPDHNFPNEEVWEFKVLYEEFRIYIKLKLKEEEFVICISFHEDEI